MLEKSLWEDVRFPFCVPFKSHLFICDKCCQNMELVAPGSQAGEWAMGNEAGVGLATGP